MKKGISKNRVQRMRNLVSGNHNAKSVVRSGYTKKLADHKEGDVWFAKGKKWTIKNGVTRTVNKLDFARKINRIPFACPSCAKSLKHSAHKAMYKRWGMCLTCVTVWEHEMKESGTYDEWHSQFDKENYDAFITDIRQEYNGWLESRGSQSFITEAGQIEEWSGGKTNTELKQEFNDTITKVKEIRDDK
tara:strand:+ start:835 stop:1401 length:567 start_codon:yes stop_codon:yes gene_type:complete